MRTGLVLIVCLLATGGCREDVEIPDGFCARLDLKGAPADMTPQSPKCAAAKGLPGDNLICIDFASMPDQTLGSPPPSKLAGWDFTSLCPAGWEIKGGQLQVRNFSTFMGTCSFSTSALTASDYQNHNTFTLSVVQTLDINKLKQSAGVYLGLAVDTQQMWLSTGTNPRQVNTLTVAKAALPNGGNGYQPLFQITSGITIGLAGWQIESIAVNASP